MVKPFSIEIQRDPYECFIGKYVYLFTLDGPLIGNLKEINRDDYVLSPYSDVRFNSDGMQKFFLNEKEFYYKKSHVRGIKETDKESLEKYLEIQNKSNEKLNKK